MADSVPHRSADEQSVGHSPMHVDRNAMEAEPGQTQRLFSMDEIGLATDASRGS